MVTVGVKERRIHGQQTTNDKVQLGSNSHEVFEALIIDELKTGNQIAEL
jgi:hypothetical protein